MLADEGSREVRVDATASEAAPGRARGVPEARPTVRSSVAIAFALAAVFGLPVLGDRAANAHREADATARSVLVPVQVLTRGEPVRGLTRDDFRIFEGGKRREITSFDVVDLEVTRGAALVPGSEHAPPISGRRHFLIVFDLSFSEPGAIARARRHIRDWVTTSLHPTDLVAVATFTVGRGPELLLNFTADRDEIALAIATFGRPDWVERSDEPLGFRLGAARSEELDGAFRSGLLDGYTLPPDDDVFGAGALEVQLGAGQRVADQEQRHPIHLMTASFGGLAKLMRSIDGRKHVVYLSEGFDGSLVFAESDTSDVSRMNEAVAEGAIWRVDTSKRFGAGPTQSGILAMLEEFRRADCAIQAIDVRSFHESGAARVLPASADTLHLFARETGGDVYRDFADVGRALDRMLRATSVTYVLSFTPKSAPDGDRFHPIKVKLATPRKKTVVRHRPGYYGDRAYGAGSDAERRFVAGRRLLEGRPGGALATRTLCAPYPGAGDTQMLPLLLEIDGPSLLEGHRGREVAAEIYAYAFDERGRLADFVAETLRLDLGKLGGAVRDGGVKFYAELDLEPGEYWVRILAVERSSGRSGLTVTHVRVDPSRDAPRLLAPQFPEPRGSWLLVRDPALSKPDAAMRFPFVVGSDPYLPEALPRIAAGARRQVIVPAVDFEEPPRSVEFLVHDAGGGIAARHEVAVDARPGSDPAARQLVATWEAAGLDPGIYTLSARATLAGDRFTTSTTTPLLVTVPDRDERARRGG